MTTIITWTTARCHVCGAITSVNNGLLTVHQMGSDLRITCPASGARARLRGGAGDEMNCRFSLIEKPTEWLNEMATHHHYMRRPIHPKSCPFGWGVAFDGQVCQPDGRPAGFITFASIHYTRLQGEFGYPGLPTKWQVLSLARLWLHPDFQAGGRYYSPDILPGFTDRKGAFRSTLATVVIEMALGLVQGRWLEVHPPRFMNEPYHILKVISYADMSRFSGAIYRAANFRDSGSTRSQKRHINSRGPGIGDVELRRYIRDLELPEWDFQPLQPRLIEQ